MTNTFLICSKAGLRSEEEKRGRRWKESITTSLRGVNNWSNVSVKSPSLTTKPNAKIKARHHNYNILTDQTQSQRRSQSAPARLSLPCLSLGIIWASYRPLCSSDIQYIQTSLSYWWTAKMQCAVPVSSSLLSFQKDFFIIHDTEKLIWSATAVKPERLIFTVTTAKDRNTMIWHLRHPTAR